jgi:hypothetical protein
MMVMHKSNMNILHLIQRKLSKGKTKNDDAAIYKKTDENEIIQNSDVNELNTFVNKISLFDVSADQVEEVGDAAVKA